MKNTLRSWISRALIFALVLPSLSASFLLVFPSKEASAQDAKLPSTETMGEVWANLLEMPWDSCVEDKGEFCGYAREAMQERIKNLFEGIPRAEIAKNPLAKAILARYDKLRTYNMIEDAFQECNKGGFKSSTQLYDQILSGATRADENVVTNACSTGVSILDDEGALANLMRDIAKPISADPADLDLARGQNDEAMRLMARNYMDTVVRYAEGSGCNTDVESINQSSALMFSGPAAEARLDKEVVKVVADEMKSYRAQVLGLIKAERDGDVTAKGGYECTSFTQAASDINRRLGAVNQALRDVVYPGKNMVKSLFSSNAAGMLMPEPSDEEAHAESEYLNKLAEAMSSGSGVLLMTHYFQEEKPVVGLPRHHLMDDDVSIKKWDGKQTRFEEHSTSVSADDVKKAVDSRKAHIRSRLADLFNKRKELDRLAADLAKVPADKQKDSYSAKEIRKIMADQVYENPVAAGVYLMSRPEQVGRFCQYVAVKERAIEDRRKMYERADGVIMVGGAVTGVAFAGSALFSGLHRLTSRGLLRSSLASRVTGGMARAGWAATGASGAIFGVLGAYETYNAHDRTVFWENLRSERLTTAGSDSAASPEVVKEYQEAITNLQKAMTDFKWAGVFTAVDLLGLGVAVNALRSPAEKTRFIRNMTSNLNSLGKRSKLLSSLESIVQDRYLFPFQLKIGYLDPKKAEAFYAALEKSDHLSKKDWNDIFAAFSMLGDNPEDVARFRGIVDDFIANANDRTGKISPEDLASLFNKQGIELANAQDDFRQSLGQLRIAPTREALADIEAALKSAGLKKSDYSVGENGHLVLKSNSSVDGHPANQLASVLESTIKEGDEAVEIRVNRKVPGDFSIDEVDGKKVLNLDSDLLAKIAKLDKKQQDELYERIGKCRRAVGAR